ncbi:hypothetical protein Tco_0132380 [Tanacetum coccineum]
MVSYQRDREVIPSLMMLVQDSLYRKSPSHVFAVVELTLQVTINNGRRREVKYRQSQEVLVDIPERITEHGLSSENTQSSGGSSDASEGSENSGSFEDYGRSDED